MCCGAPVDGRATFSTWATASCQAPLWSRLRRWRITCTKCRSPGNSRWPVVGNSRMSSAVLLMAHGTPSSMDEMPEYLTRVRGGRPPSDELIGEMRRNYGAIGGRSPLADITLQQRNALRDSLGGGVKVIVGMRNWHPLIGDVLGALAGSDVTRVVGIPLAPQFSTLSVKTYVEAAMSAMPPGIGFECVTSYHDHPLLLQAFAERIWEAGMPSAGEAVVFTAHALPERVIAEGNPSYLEQVRATARGVADRAGAVPRRTLPRVSWPARRCRTGSPCGRRRSQSARPSGAALPMPHDCESRRRGRGRSTAPSCGPRSGRPGRTSRSRPGPRRST